MSSLAFALKFSGTLHMLSKGVTVGPGVLLGITEVSGGDGDELDVMTIGVGAPSPGLVKAPPGGDSLTSNVCDALAMVARVFWKC